MYYYIYDSFVTDKKHLPTVHAVEARLTDLGINGRIEKLTVLKNMKEIVEDAVKKGAKTIVGVGDDSTVSKIISYLPNLNITLGIIPIGPNNKIASLLGIAPGEEACNVLSARIIEKIDLGKANDNYFISKLAVPSQKQITMDAGTYRIRQLSEYNHINICNFDIQQALDRDTSARSNPKDGILEAVISAQKKRSGLWSMFQQKTYSRKSVFPFKKIKIKCDSDSVPVIADDQVTIKTPVTVEVAPKKLKIIVGKNRMF